MFKQRGVTILGLLAVCIVLVFGALLGLKVAPAYIEYFSVKKAVSGIVASGEGTGSVGEIRKSFDRRAQIDDITVVSAQDLEITKEGGEVVISFEYPKKVPLFGNVSLYFEFSGASNQ